VRRSIAAGVMRAKSARPRLHPPGRQRPHRGATWWRSAIGGPDGTLPVTAASVGRTGHVRDHSRLRTELTIVGAHDNEAPAAGEAPAGQHVARVDPPKRRLIAREQVGYRRGT
jgi:hypothetical protein